MICLVEAMQPQPGIHHKAYVVLGGEGWKPRSFYTSGRLQAIFEKLGERGSSNPRFVHRKSKGDDLMADDTTQHAAHKFFAERLHTLEPFTKEDVLNATGWTLDTLNTYWSKQFRGFIEDLGSGTYRVQERFRQFLNWRKFLALVTQVKTLPPIYNPTTLDEVVVYEFYIPLTHESALRVTLDSLFYKDAILPRLKRIGIGRMKTYLEWKTTDDENSYLERVCSFVEEKFSGYSIYHVDGRFRTARLSTQEQAVEINKTGRYLVDETTAVSRFIFPCETDQADTVRFLFKELVINAITEQVSGEDEIWVVETGMRNQINIWKPGGE